MLAWRYLNPRRAMLSAVTLISVTGVLLGVLVLVVVMAVYAGMEQQVKERLLGSSPHIHLQFSPFGGSEVITDWREIATEVAKTPGVTSSTAFVQEYALMSDLATRKRAVFFQGVDTQDPSQVAGIDKLLDRTDHPDSSADMGLDDRVVISSILANQFELRVGDTVKFLSPKIIDDIEAIHNVTNRPPVREEFAPQLQAAKDILDGGFEAREDGVWLSMANYRKLYEPLFYEIYDQGVRDVENQIVAKFLSLLDGGLEEGEGVLYPADTQAKGRAILAELDATDVEKMDADITKNIKEIVLPKEATVIGIYLASNLAFSPDVYMPLPLAQELAGLQGAVQGIGVRLEDPYMAEVFAQQIAAKLPEGWRTETWIVKLGEISVIINQQRIMMYFALSFIILVSAFSMMAVMFTVTIQKRREIGVMKALGAAPGQIVRVFVYQGMILGFLGALLGTGMGIFVLLFRGHLQAALRGMGFDPFPKSFLGFEELPVAWNPVEITVIAISAFVLCSIAAFVPAFFAARSDAAKSLRNL